MKKCPWIQSLLHCIFSLQDNLPLPLKGEWSNPCIFVLERSQQIQNLQINNNNSETKKNWILSSFKVKIEFFWDFKDGWRRQTFSKGVLLSWRSEKFWCRNWNRHHRVPYNKQLTNWACSGHTGEYWPEVREVHTATTEGY